MSGPIASTRRMLTSLRPRNLSVRGKLIGLSMLVTGGAVLLSLLVLGLHNARLTNQDTIDRLHSQARMIGAGVSGPLVEENEQDARRVLMLLRQDEAVVSASVFDASGRLFAHYSRAEQRSREAAAAAPDTPKPADDPSVSDDGLEVWQTLRDQGREVGKLHLKADLSTLREAIRYQILALVLSLAAALCLAYLLSARLQGAISAPLQRLAEAVGSVSQHRDFSMRVEPAGHDEIGSLMGAFNRLLEEIQQRDARLQQRANLLESLNAQLRHQAFHDALTGLPNRELLNDRVDMALLESRRRERHVGVLFFDLDRFKTINDTLGHETGDELLKLVAARLREGVRRDDTVARLGGDEFVVLLPSQASPDDAGDIAFKLLRELEQPFHVKGHELQVTPSIGVAVGPDDGANRNTLMRCADSAMYQAKAGGGARFVFYDSDMHAQSMRRLEMESRLRSALANDEFHLLYQPLYGLAENRVVGMEALLRWQSADLGLVSPEEFVPILEDTGLILAVGEWIFQSVCRQAREWLDADLLMVPISVNVSARQFRHATPALSLPKIIDRAGVPRELLTLEMTETVLMHDTQETVSVLKHLHALDISVAIDDFGTGYSSLSYLREFPIDAVKIDRSFIQGLTPGSNDATIVTATVAMAHALGLKVVAEGVETHAQLDYLRNCGCDVGQGYLFDRPLSPKDMAQRLGPRTQCDPALSQTRKVSRNLA